MLTLVVGLALFLGVHLLPTQTDLRSGLVGRFGLNAYKGVFALLSAVGLALIVLGYHKLQLHPGKNPQIWTPPTAMRHIAATLMLPAMILLVAAYTPSRICTRETPDAARGEAVGVFAPAGQRRPWRHVAVWKLPGVGGL